MILTINIELEKSKENYQAVIDALAEFDIASTSWEDASKPVEVKADPSVRMDKNIDPAGALSQAVDRAKRRANGN